MLHYYALPLFLASLSLVDSRAIHTPSDYELTHQTIRRPHCITETDCQRLGLPFLPPSPPHSDSLSHLNPLDGVIYICGPARTIVVTDAMAGRYIYEVVGAHGGDMTGTSHGTSGDVVRGSIALGAGADLVIQPGCKGYDSPDSGGEGGASVFSTASPRVVVKATGGAGGNGAMIGTYRLL